MKKLTVKIPAKINLSLDVLGTKDKFHEINTLVASVSVYDTITVEKRDDNRITLTMKGLPVDCDLPDNNAYKATKMFVETFSVGGVNVIIDKKIPVGGGMGGSSADIAGVLRALNELFEVDMDMGELADRLGSDARYMLSGGYATLSGRGEIITEQFISKQLYLVIVSEDKSVSSRACYKAFDQMGKMHKPCTAGVVKALLGGDFEKYASIAKNDLYLPALSMLKELEHNIYNLKKAGAPVVKAYE
jgi:4-diphosphocytidyl-2-C-methyl-D-erythritol kinase